MAEVQTLTVEEVLNIHNFLVADFAAAGDPIAPGGVKNMGLVESAVNRQHTSLGGSLKYPDPLANAATLTFGVCCAHGFNNGNKRTALVSMLVHLEKNSFCLRDTRQDALYALMLAIAKHTIGLRPSPKDRPQVDLDRRPVDEQVAAIKDWLNDRVGTLRRGDRTITYRQLRQILRRFDFDFDTPKSNRIDVVRIKKVRSGFLGRKEVLEKKRLTTIGYRDEGTEVSYKDLRQVRRECKLTEDDGVDTDAFYEDAEVVDAFVNRYRMVLRRLSKN